MVRLGRAKAIGGRRMRKQQMYTLSLDCIRKINMNIMRGNRSQFVENAILEKLKLKETSSIQEHDERQVAAILHAKLDDNRDRLTAVLKNTLKEWLMS